MLNHPTVSSTLLSIGFFGVGSAYTLYQLCFGSGGDDGDGAERNRKTSQTTTYPPPPPLHTDNLHRILAHLPLGERLQTSRQVNSEWAQVVAGQFRRQKILALRIGTGQSEERWADLKNYYQFKPQYIPPQHVHPFQSMAVEVLTGTLTTLQMVFIVEKTAFQAHFPSLFESFSSLTRLKHFTLMDFDLKLTLPASFNLKELLPNSLETLKLHFSHCSVPELHQSLQRYLRNTQKEGNPLKIDLVLGSYARRSASLAALAAHLHALYLIAYSAEDLMLFCSRFTALRQLLCWTFRLPSLAGTVAQLAPPAALNKEGHSRPRLPWPTPPPDSAARRPASGALPLPLAHRTLCRLWLDAAQAARPSTYFEAALRRCLSKVAAPFAFAAPTTATKPSFFSAYTIVTPCQYFVCHILAEDWPEVKVKKALSTAEAAGAAGEAEDNEKVEVFKFRIVAFN
ncbi:hypothetical protein TYRP_019510, partial [Tyrophagus putrescentiae]